MSPNFILAYNMPIGEAAIVSLISICIVMLVLAVMAGVLSSFGIVYRMNLKKEEEKKAKELALKEAEKKEESVAEIKKEPVVEVKEEPVISETLESVSYIDDKELVAVITAAIAASANTTTDKIIVRSIRKVNSWKNTALKEKINSVY